MISKTTGLPALSASRTSGTLDLAGSLLSVGAEVQGLLVQSILTPKNRKTAQRLQKYSDLIVGCVDGLLKEAEGSPLAIKLEDHAITLLANPVKVIELAVSEGLSEQESAGRLRELFQKIYQSLGSSRSDPSCLPSGPTQRAIEFVYAPGVLNTDTVESEGMLLRPEGNLAYILAPSADGYFIVSDLSISKSLENLGLIKQGVPDPCSLARFQEFNDRRKHSVEEKNAWFSLSAKYHRQAGASNSEDRVATIFETYSQFGRIYTSADLTVDCSHLRGSFYAEALNPASTAAEYRIFAVDYSGRLLVLNSSRDNDYLRKIANAMKPCFFPADVAGSELIVQYRSAPSLPTGNLSTEGPVIPRNIRPWGSDLQLADFENLTLGRTDLTEADARALSRREKPSPVAGESIFNDLGSPPCSATYISYEKLLSAVEVSLQTKLIALIKGNPKVPFMLSETVDNKPVTLVFGSDRLAIIDGLQNSSMLQNFRAVPVNSGGELSNSVKFIATLALASMEDRPHREFLEKLFLNTPRSLAFDSVSINFLADSAKENDLMSFKDGSRFRELKGSYFDYQKDDLLVCVRAGKLILLSDTERKAALNYVKKYFREFDYCQDRREARLINSALKLKSHLSDMRSNQPKHARFCNSLPNLATRLGSTDPVSLCGSVPYKQIMGNVDPESREHFRFLQSAGLFNNSRIFVLESQDIVVFREKHAEVWGQIKNTRTSEFLAQTEKNLATCQPTALTENLAGFVLFIAFRAVETARNISLADEVKKDNRDQVLADLRQEPQAIILDYLQLNNIFPSHLQLINRLSRLGDVSIALNSEDKTGLLICSDDGVILLPQHDRVMAYRVGRYFPAKPLLEAFSGNELLNAGSQEFALLNNFGAALAEKYFNPPIVKQSTDKILALTGNPQAFPRLNGSQQLANILGILRSSALTSNRRR